MRYILASIEREAARAADKYGSPASTHESIGVLMEEFDELKAAVHLNDRYAIYDEAIQIAAVAARLAWSAFNDQGEFSRRSGLK